MKPYPLILASTSRYRSNLLKQLGWDFESIAPGVDEDRFKTGELTPSQLAQELAQLKAGAVFEKRPDACVIGSDQVCTLDQLILSKPGSFVRALEQLRQMQGQSHELITAVSLIYPKGKVAFTNRTRLHMRELTDLEITRYLKADEPYDCAGSYKLESRGITLFKKIEMDDHTSIIGLPLLELTNQLLKLGYTL